MYSIIARRAFNAPLAGSFEMTELCLVVIVFTILAFDSLKHESMTVELIVNHFSKRIQLILAPIIHFLSVCMLGVLSWQLFVQALRVQGFHQTTRILQIPIYPFLYLAAVGVLFLMIVYLNHFLKSLDKAVK
jgi:TRAP-type C4-dicarboxylate transport system permease small subunit